MEEREGQHRLMMSGRKTGQITGVVDVISFDTETVLLETTQGMLTIKGQELHISRLCLEEGQVDVEGLFVLLQYSENGSYGQKKKGSLMKRLFQ